MPCTVVSRSILRIGLILLRIEERDGALIDGVLRAEEDHLALRDDDAAEHAGMIGRAAQGEVGVGLQVLRERGAELDVGRGLDLDVEAHAAEQAGARGGGRRRRGGRTSAWSRYRSGSAARRPRCDGAGDQAARRWCRPATMRALACVVTLSGAVDADVVGIGGDAELHLGTAVGDEAGERDLAAAGLAGEVLDDRLRAVERDGPVGVGEAVGHVQHVERGVLQLQAAVDDGLVGGAGDGGVQGDAAGGEDVRAEGFEDFELDVAVGAQVESLRGRRWTRCR